MKFDRIPRPLQAVLFDFDGTLAPNLDLPGMRADVVAYTRSCGVPDHVFDGLYILEIIDAASAWLQSQSSVPVSATAYARQAHRIIIDIELGAAASTGVFPGVETLLADIARRNIGIGVVTRNCREAVVATFPQILDHVDVLHARGDVEYLKPDVRHLEATLAALGASADRTVMVGDGQLDMTVGKAVGTCCVGVLSGSSDHAGLMTAGADLVLTDCLELAPLLAE